MIDAADVVIPPLTGKLNDLEPPPLLSTLRKGKTVMGGRTGTKGFARKWTMKSYEPPKNPRSSYGTLVFLLTCGHEERRHSPPAARWKLLVCSTCRKEADA